MGKIKSLKINPNMPNDALVNICGIYITEKLFKLLQLRSELLWNISKIIVFVNRRNINSTKFRSVPREYCDFSPLHAPCSNKEIYSRTQDSRVYRALQDVTRRCFCSNVMLLLSN